METLGPDGARVAFVNTIEETANAILSHDFDVQIEGDAPILYTYMGSLQGRLYQACQ